MLAGHKDALDLAQRAAAAKGALKVVLLPVSGAFHTGLMKPAQDALVKARPSVRPPLQPRLAVRIARADVSAVI